MMQITVSNTETMTDEQSKNHRLTIEMLLLKYAINTEYNK